MIVASGVQVVCAIMEQDGGIADAEHAVKIIRRYPVDDNGLNQHRICIGVFHLCAGCGKDHETQQAKHGGAYKKCYVLLFAHPFIHIGKSG